MGLGSIIRDFAGYFMIARSINMKGLLNPAVAEALSIKEALSWAKEM